ncbi:autoinducer 2 ABC transporter membrane protein [Pasteurella testudinis DSM 23072]|uniref:Autoinducer 2 import system permease protein LsrD n=1 Tax=Pasteurella testudinis DSM 23072 TaxID=1122938 RepID=A0A1W1UBK6_9PAST|nr:autoinducer 2 ABC transporter permease LsrD [Pasteurella testudinis]SMB78412.1 autoinducer 2 ABC transporter membrane protein [Pasteurella testudinis DSM 23072]SUB52604.1 autoinducer 2 import system permease protein lsrD [Pasteurella testudinis]
MLKLKSYIKNYAWESALFCLLIIEILGFGMLNPRMLDINVLLYSTSDFIYIGMLALPLTMIIVSGGIDISFGSTVGLCAIFLGVLFKADISLFLAIPLTLLLGGVCGLFNAGLIIYTKVNPLVITLGTMYLYGGGALLLSGFAGATGYEGIGGFPDSLLEFANQTLFGIPTPILYFLIMSVIFWLLMHKTTVGRSTFLIGQSERTARYSATPVNKTLFTIYSAIGLVAAFVAILLVSYFGSARSDLGSSLLMPVLTAVVLGGANIYGGSGSILGTAIAALLIGYLQQGLQMIGIPNEISSALSGALLIIVLIGKSISLHYSSIHYWIRRKSGKQVVSHHQ